MRAVAPDDPGRVIGPPHDRDRHCQLGGAGDVAAHEGHTVLDGELLHPRGKLERQPLRPRGQSERQIGLARVGAHRGQV